MILERGIIHAYNSTAHTAAVQLFGSMSRIIYDVPVAHHIGPVLLASEIACLVGFVGEGSQAVIIATFDGPPDPWITSALIKDGEIAPADLAFTPPTPDFTMAQTSSSQTITNAWTTYAGMTVTVTVPAGKTYNVLATFDVDTETTAYTAYNIHVTRIYQGSSGLGQPSRHRTNNNNHRATLSCTVAHQITATTTYTGRIYKAINRNTCRANSGTLTVLWWEATV